MMARLFANRIIRGVMTLEEVPAMWREQTRALLVADGYYDQGGE